MKRILLLIVFFAGLIPNLKEMCMESVYEVKGQSFYDEFEIEIDTFPHCYICLGSLVEVGFGSETIEYCPNCEFYCELCNKAFYRTPSPDDIAIHFSAEHENNSGGNDNDEEDDNNDSNEENVKYYICLECPNIKLLTIEERIEHEKQYFHRLYKEISDK